MRETGGLLPEPLRRAPLPVEAGWGLPAQLDGSRGSNRSSSGHCQITARNDIEAIECWLAEFDGSPNTQRNYRKEAERLMLWAVTVCNLPLSGLTREHFQQYQAFLCDPQPAVYWCGPRAERGTPGWRPFQGPLSNASHRQAMIVVNALLSYLVAAGYLAGNPLSLIRRKKKVLAPSAKDKMKLERFLDREAWEVLKSYIESMPKTTTRQVQIYERVRFLFHFLYLLAPRVSEAAGHPMNSFRLVRGRWWWFVEGKGQKRAKVPVTDEMLHALARYRQFLGMEPLPAPDDFSPLLRSIAGSRDVTASTVYRVVKKVVGAAAAGVQEDRPHLAAQLAAASTHWFRHTSITHGSDTGVGLKYLNLSARHDKLETTAHYQHAEDDAWHEEWQKLRY